MQGSYCDLERKLQGGELTETDYTAPQDYGTEKNHCTAPQACLEDKELPPLPIMVSVSVYIPLLCSKHSRFK